MRGGRNLGQEPPFCPAVRGVKEVLWGSARDSSKHNSYAEIQALIAAGKSLGDSPFPEGKFLQPQLVPSLTHLSVLHLQLPADARSVPKDSWQQRHQGRLPVPSDFISLLRSRT